MAAGRVQGIPLDRSFPYKTITIDRSHVIGEGSYGRVYLAECDSIPCAAKTIHSIIRKAAGPNKVLNNFLKECDLLRSLSHPNVVQFIGVCTIQGEDDHVLLTELMDESLWSFINCTRKTDLNTEISIMHDVASALAYLHSNGITHRDLSSNNILLNKDKIAKITNFGVAKLKDATKKYLTQCPGTPVFMAPEALVDDSLYTNKLDIFSWAVVGIHLLSGCDPNPGPRLISERDQNGQEVFKPVLEVHRRSKEINKIDLSHPLLSLITCSLGEAGCRPSADDLCAKIESIKSEIRKENEMKIRKKDENTTQKEENKEKLTSGGRRQEKDTEMHKEDKLKENSQTIITKILTVEAVGDEVKHSKVDINEPSETRKEKTPNSTSEDIITPISPPSFLLSGDDPFSWSTTKNEAPCVFPAGSSITTLAGQIFLARPHSSTIHIYDPTSMKWSTLLAQCPVENFTLVSHIGKILAIGGITHKTRKGSKVVYSYDILNSNPNTPWSHNLLQEMSYQRVFPTVASWERKLLVAGGTDPTNNLPLNCVEVHDGSKWYSTYSLSVPVSLGTALISDQGTVFVIGGTKSKGTYIQSCSLETLVAWSSSWMIPIAVRETWKTTPSPISFPTAVLVAKQLVLMGGVLEQHGRSLDNNDEYSNNLYMRPMDCDSKFNISLVPRARGCCLATVLPSNNRLIMIVGGCGSKAIDFGKFEHNY